MSKPCRPFSRLGTTILVLTLMLLLAACAASPGTTAATTKTSATSGETTTASERSFTLEELAQFDGQNGNQAYIAVDGIVYDVTEVGVWDHKLHVGRFTAGKDYTEELKKAPHTAAMLSQATKIGVLVQ